MASDPITKAEKSEAEKKPLHPSLMGFSKMTARMLGTFIPSPILARLPSASKETFYCQICYENVDVDEAYTFHGGGGPCVHKFCRECLSQYIAVSVTDAGLHMQCPMFFDQDCAAEMSESDMNILCSDEIIEKFERFQKMQEDENYRDCPKCSHQQLGNPRHAAMTCEECGEEYCFHHSNAHPGTKFDIDLGVDFD